jgi:hypothetical protein
MAGEDLNMTKINGNMFKVCECSTTVSTSCKMQNANCNMSTNFMINESTVLGTALQFVFPISIAIFFSIHLQ